MHDLLQDEHDAVFQYGLKVAMELQEQTDELGRRRHPETSGGQARVGVRCRPKRQPRGHLPPGRGLPREDETPERLRQILQHNMRAIGALAVQLHTLSVAESV